MSSSSAALGVRRRPGRPHDTSGPRAVKLVKNGTLKTYPGYPHRMLTTHADVLNPDLLAFIQS
jgi:non-heme chloroperoxidase